MFVTLERALSSFAEVLLDAKVPEVEPQTSGDAGRAGAAVGSTPEPEARPSKPPMPPAEPMPQSRQADPEPKAVGRTAPAPTKSSAEFKEGPKASARSLPRDGSTKEKPPAEQTASAVERAEVWEKATDKQEEVAPPRADKPSKAAKPKEPITQAASTGAASAAKAPATSSTHRGEAGQPEVPSQPPSNKEKPRVGESSRPQVATLQLKSLLKVLSLFQRFDVFEFLSSHLICAARENFQKLDARETAARGSGPTCKWARRESFAVTAATTGSRNWATS